MAANNQNEDITFYYKSVTCNNHDNRDSAAGLIPGVGGWRGGGGGGLNSPHLGCLQL